MKTSDIAELLALDELEAQLDAIGDILHDETRTGNVELVDPGLRVIDGGGKRLRPILAIAAARAAGGDIDANVLRGGAALELVHVGSLVHDDIIDHAETRRSVRTINSVEGPSHALLVGDFLLARAGYLASIISQDVATSLAIAISELCIGQSMETASVGQPSRTVESYLASINGKTASLIRAACRIGSQAAGVSADIVAALSEYGTNFGYAFQIVDDLLDIVATSEELGKPSGHDVEEGVFTLPVLMFLADNPGYIDGFDHRESTAVARLLDDVRSSPALEAAVASATEYAELARKALESLPDGPTLRGLADLPQWYVNRSLAGHQLVAGS